MAARRLQSVFFLPHNSVRAKGTVGSSSRGQNISNECTVPLGRTKAVCTASGRGALPNTVPLGRTEVCGKKNTLWSRRAAILDPKFNEEHDARISRPREH